MCGPAVCVKSGVRVEVKSCEIMSSRVVHTFRLYT